MLVPITRAPLASAVAQLDDPVFLGVVTRSLLLSAAVFLLLATGSFWGIEQLVGGQGWGALGWLRWIAGALGAFGALLLSVWLFVPAALAIATLYMARIADAVDRRFYPGLPEPRGASLAVQAWDGLALGGRVLLLQLVGLLLALLLPGVGLLLGWAIAGWSIGRGLFVGVAMRRMGREEAQALYARRRVPVLAQGLLLALAGTIPLLNLLVPVLGTAAMVHVLNRS